jgi:GNAT superfamily N-acetyltransferase
MVEAIRPYRDDDRDAVYGVCVDTAHAGRGARGQYSTDDLLPDIFAGPYLALEPQHAYVLDDGGRAVGYVVGTASTPDFVAAYAERSLPRLRERYQPLTEPPVSEEDYRLDSMFHPEWMLRPELAAHPAHLHINLLDGYRGQGHGRALIEQFLTSVAQAGAQSCYLAVHAGNVNARQFYARLGWQPIEVPGSEPGTFLSHPTR